MVDITQILIINSYRLTSPHHSLRHVTSPLVMLPLLNCPYLPLPYSTIRMTFSLQVSLDQILVCLAVVDRENNVKNGNSVRTLRLTGFLKNLIKDSAKAKLSKKKKTLTIDVHYC